MHHHLQRYVIMTMNGEHLQAHRMYDTTHMVCNVRTKCRGAKIYFSITSKPEPSYLWAYSSFRFAFDPSRVACSILWFYRISAENSAVYTQTTHDLPEFPVVSCVPTQFFACPKKDRLISGGLESKKTPKVKRNNRRWTCTIRDRCHEIPVGAHLISGLAHKSATPGDRGTRTSGWWTTRGIGRNAFSLNWLNKCVDLPLSTTLVDNIGKWQL